MEFTSKLLLTAFVVTGLLHSIKNANVAVESDDVHFSYTNFLTLGVRGRAFESTKHLSRLPDDAQNTVGTKTWTVSQHTAGMYVDFVSNSPIISVIYNLQESFSLNSNHMTSHRLVCLVWTYTRLTKGMRRRDGLEQLIQSPIQQLQTSWQHRCHLIETSCTDYTFLSSME